MAFKAARVIVAALLLLGLNNRPELYYTALRWMACGIAAYGVFHAMELRENTWATVFGVAALLYNPLYPIYLDHTPSTLVHIGTVIVMMTSIPALDAKEIELKQAEEERKLSVVQFRRKKRI